MGSCPSLKAELSAWGKIASGVRKVTRSARCLAQQLEEWGFQDQLPSSAWRWEGSSEAQ